MTRAPVGSVSVLGVGLAAPSLRLPVKAVTGAWGSGGARGTLGVCDSDEDTLTLAWEAAGQALAAAGLDAAELAGLWWGTARPPFAEGPSHAFLAASLGLEEDCDGALFSGSAHAGMEALLGAWDAVRAGHARRALVVASDALVPGLGTATEAATGAGAAAVVLGPPDEPAGAPAKLVARATRWMPVVDRYRADAEQATGDVYDPRLFREEIYIPLLSSAAAALSAPEDAGRSASVAPASALVLSDPDGKLGSAVSKRLGLELSSAPVTEALGDTGAAAPLMGLVLALGEGAGARGGAGARVILAVGYGAGRATAVSVEQASAVPGAQDAATKLAQGTSVDYTTALRARGQLEPMAEPIQMGLPPAGAAFARGNDEMLALRGARCKACGTISTPPSVHPACTGCGATDLETVRLARHGKVVTFVVNQTMPPPFAAPLPLVVLDLADGARIMVQGTPADAPLLRVDDEVTLALRRYALERGIPVYGYKASRVDEVEEVRA